MGPDPRTSTSVQELSLSLLAAGVVGGSWLALRLAVVPLVIRAGRNQQCRCDCERERRYARGDGGKRTG